jgi:ankyrin repeat protein
MKKFLLFNLIVLLSNEVICQDIFKTLRERNLDKFTTIIKKNPDLIETRDIEGSALLHLAARNNATNFIRVLVENGANINTRDKNGVTPLMYSTRNGDLKNVRYLIKHGADCNSKDNRGFTPVFYSLENATLLNYYDSLNVDFNVQDTSGMSALMVAINDFQGNCVADLIHAGADINLKDKRGRNVLHYAAELDNAYMVNYLLIQGAKPDEPDNDGTTPLMHAAEYGNYECVKALLSYINLDDKIKLRVTDAHGVPLLSYAIFGCDFKTINLVVSVSENVDKKDDIMGMTPLIYASAFCDYLAIKLLIEKGADVTLTDTSGMNALMWYFLETGYNNYENSTLMARPLIDLFLEKGIDINAQDNEGFTVLMNASMLGYISVVDYLISKGADPDIKNYKGLTAFDLAKIKELKRTKHSLRRNSDYLKN